MEPTVSVPTTTVSGVAAGAGWCVITRAHNTHQPVIMHWRLVKRRFRWTDISRHVVSNRSDTKFPDRYMYILANGVEPVEGLHCLPFHLYPLDTEVLCKRCFVQF